MGGCRLAHLYSCSAHFRLYLSIDLFHSFHIYLRIYICSYEYMWWGVLSVWVCAYYMLRTSIDKVKHNGLKLTKERGRRYPAETITDADSADDIALLEITPTHAETLLDCLERTAAGIGFHVNADKTECMIFNQRGDFSTLSSSSLKLVDKFIYLGSSVLSS